MKHKLVFLYPILLFVYSIYSYSQTDPNLILSSNGQFLKFQQTMWQLGFSNRLLSTSIFLFLCLVLFLLYGYILRIIREKSFGVKKILLLFGLSLAALLPSYPALSHDIFNYIFNAKMVVDYHANPHVMVAMDFPNDPWLRFMHNIHTPAPYGYGWTAISLIPYVVGGGYLQAELLVFRTLMIGSLVASLYFLTKIKKLSYHRLGFLAFNPLILIEIVGNIHNDLVMMALVLASYVVFIDGYKEKKWWKMGVGGVIFALSVLVKFSSVLLIFAWVAWKLTRKLSLVKWSVLSQWSPLITTRSQRFLPWYLSWSLVFLPLIDNRDWQKIMVLTSFSGLASYWLILYHGEYSPMLLTQRSLWLFGIPLISIFIYKLLRHHNEIKH